MAGGGRRGGVGAGVGVSVGVGVGVGVGKRDKGLAVDTGGAAVAVAGT